MPSPPVPGAKYRAVKVFRESLDEEFVRVRYGGGVWRIFLKKGPEIVGVKEFETEGPSRQITARGRCVARGRGRPERRGNQ